MEFSGNNVVSIFEVTDALKDLGIDVWQLNVENPFSHTPQVIIKGFFSGKKKSQESRIVPKHIFKNGLYTTVMWSDGTKTIVKRGEDEPDDEYTAFTAALAKKLYGSTSAVKRIVGMTKVQSKKYKEASDCAEKDACEIAVENHGCNEDKGETLNDLVRKQWEDYLKGEKG